MLFVVDGDTDDVKADIPAGRSNNDDGRKNFIVFREFYQSVVIVLDNIIFQLLLWDKVYL